MTFSLPTSSLILFISFAFIENLPLTISDILYSSGLKTKEEVKADFKVSDRVERFSDGKLLDMDPSEVAKIISGLEEKMNLEARELNFEKAAVIRDEIKRITKITKIEIRK